MKLLKTGHGSLLPSKVCVEVSVDDELPESIDVDIGEGDSIVVQVDYPWKPPTPSVELSVTQIANVV